MTKITNIEEADEYITTLSFYDIINGNKAEYLVTFNVCEALALEHNYDRVLCRTRTLIMYLYIEENKLQEATQLAEQNLQFAKANKLDDELLYMIAIVAHLYRTTGNLSAAEELIQIALDRIPSLTDNTKISKVYSLVAEQYFFTNNKEKCIETYEKCLEFAFKTTNYNMLALAHNNYAEYLLEYNLNDEAFRIIESGNKFAIATKNKSLISQLNGIYGLYYFRMKEYKKSIQYDLQQLNYTISIKNVQEEMEIRIDLGKTYFLDKKYRQAFEQMKKAEEMALESNANKALLSIYELFVEYYETNKKYQLAFQYLKKYNQIHELIYSKESDDKIKNLQITHEVKTIKQERQYAENMARIKHDFLANMSHEIRTPINSILGICYLLQQDELSEKQLNYVKRLNYSGENLLGIINDVLDISKIEAGKFNLIAEPFSVVEVVKNTHHLMLLKAEEKGIQFTFSIAENIPVYCIGDATRISQILLNLISNAIKFTKEGNVHLNVIAIELLSQKTTIQFILSDTGIGMSAAQKQKIFNEYEQATDTTQQKFGGTGLGLSITKKLVELMNGIIDVESIENIGSTFKVNIPFDLPLDLARTIETTKYNLDNLNNKLILIADDVEENRNVLAEILVSLNPTLQLEFAKNGNEAIEIVKQKTPDFILMDLDMPELNGFEATAFIQSNYPNHTIKIIACTASLLMMSKEELAECGFKDLLQKPFTIKQLIHVISN